MNICEANNGQSSAEPLRPKSRLHNAKHCPLAIQERIINALANGDSKSQIAHALRVSRNTVKVIEEQQWSKVEQRKARIAAQSERNATRAAELIAEKLESENVPLNVLVPVYGVSVDKAIALRGDPCLTIDVKHRHEHSHSIQLQLLEQLKALNAQAREKPAQATVVEVPALSAKTRHHREEKAAQKKVL